MENLEKPKRVHQAVMLLWAMTFGIGVIRVVLEFPRLAEASAPIGGGAFVIGVQAFTFLILGLIIFFISRRHRWALILYTALTVIGMPFSIGPLVESLRSEPVSGALGILQNLGQVAALVMLWFPDSRAWFFKKPVPPAMTPPPPPPLPPTI